MKKVIICITTLLLFSTCKKYEIEPDPSANNVTNPTPVPSFDAKYNGNDPGGWSVTGSGIVGNIKITATGADNRTVILSGITATTTGTFPIQGYNATWSHYVAPTTAEWYTTGVSPYVGTITITLFNASMNTISGSFSFYGYSSSSSPLTFTGSFSNVVW